MSPRSTAWLLFATLAFPSAAPAQDTTSRAMPSPLPSPPFPSSEWLGGPVIGEPDATPDYPLQRVVFGSSLAPSRIKVYGWLNVAADVSTSKHSNVPLSPAIVPNAIEFDQAVLRIERVPNTVQSAHVDWGFRFTSLYGIDYRYTTAQGWLSDQLLERNALYGYDPVELYGVLYLPSVAQGLVLKVGRFASPADIDDPFAPDNYLLTHPLTITVDPVTFTGVEGAVRLNAQWALTAGLDAGSDMAPWTSSARLNGQLLVRWVSQRNDDALWGGINSIGSGQFRNGHDDLQQVVATWGHRFNDRLHMMTEVYYLWQWNAAKGGSCNYGPVEEYGGGGGCGPIIPGRSEAIAAVNYFQLLVSPRDYLSLRTDYLHDVQGQRTGYATPYGTFTAGWLHGFSDLAFMRGEARYDRAFRATPYDNGAQRDQATLSIDVVVRY